LIDNWSEQGRNDVMYSRNVTHWRKVRRQTVCPSRASRLSTGFRRLGTEAISFCLLALLCACFSAAQAQAGPPRSAVSGFGRPLSGIVHEGPHGSDLKIFVAGHAAFEKPLNLPELGPLFNNRTCIACHWGPAIGGTGEFMSEIRVRNDPTGGPVHIFAADNILRGGAQSQGNTPVFTAGLMSMPLGCPITSPGCQPSNCQIEEMERTTFSTSLQICDPTSQSFADGDNCSAERQVLPLFGDGLVEAVADQTFIDLAASEPANVAGTVKMLNELGSERVGRFGWKIEGATLRGFATLAASNEIGLTTPDAPAENTSCADGKTQFGILLDTGQEPEDKTDASGRAEVDRIVDFIRGLAPPPRLRENAQAAAGHRIFASIGCAGCHTETLITASNPASFLPPTTGGVPITKSLNRILARRTFHPFGDFLMHDMGSLGDGITNGSSGPTMMRTVPLWGLRAKVRFLHDGRAADVATAILLHDGQGKNAAQQFEALSPSQRQTLLSFLGTL
jgi:Di-haem oxidoreductase, putative peroxidase